MIGRCVSLTHQLKTTSSFVRTAIFITACMNSNFVVLYERVRLVFVCVAACHRLSQKYHVLSLSVVLMSAVLNGQFFPRQP